MNKKRFKQQIKSMTLSKSNITKQSIEGEKSKVKSFKSMNFDILFMLIAIVEFVVFLKIGFSLTTICSLVFFSYIVYYILTIHYKFGNIYIYSNKLTFGKDEIFFSNISKVIYKGRMISYELHDENKKRKIEFRKVKGATYLFNKLEEFGNKNSLIQLQNIT